MLKITLLAATALSLALPAYASTIAAYDTLNADTVSASLVADGVTADDITRGSGLAFVGTVGTGSYKSKRWTKGGSAALALSNNDFYEWGISATKTHRLEDLFVAYDRNNNGPKAIAVFASYDGGAFTEIFRDETVSTAGEIANIDLGDVDVLNATFRLVGWDADKNNGRLILRRNRVGPDASYGVALGGHVLASVPLPASLPLMIGGLGLFGLLRHKA